MKNKPYDTFLDWLGFEYGEDVVTQYKKLAVKGWKELDDVNYITHAIRFQDDPDVYIEWADIAYEWRCLLMPRLRNDMRHKIDMAEHLKKLDDDLFSVPTREPEKTEVAAEIEAEVEAHHGYGPSASHTWMFCAAAPKAQVGYPNTSSPASRLGSAAHALGEAVLREPDVNCADLIGQPIYKSPDNNEVFTVDQEMADYVQGYVDYVRALVAETEGTLLVEKRVDLSLVVPGGFGTADAIVIGADGTVHVVDLKYGMSIVFIKHGDHWNSQAMMYGIGVIEDYGFEYDMKQFVLTIYQPRKDHIDVSDPIPMSEMLEWAEWGTEQYLLTLEDDPDYTPGDLQCKWCRARHDCKAKVEHSAGFLFEGFEVEGDFTEQVTTLPLVDTSKMSNDDLGALELRRLEVAKLFKDNAGEVKKRLEDGQPFSNVKLVVGKGSQAYTDEDKAGKALARLCGIEVASPRKLATPSAAQKLKTKSGEVVGKTRWVKAYVEKLPGGPTVAPIDDKRPTYETVDLTEGF